MDQAHRPLSGSPTGAPQLLPSGGATLHTTDATSSAQGGPFLQWVTLWVVNDHTAAQNAAFIINGVTIEVTVAAGAIVKVFDNQPFRSQTAGTGLTITGGNSSELGNMHAFGYYFAG